MITKRLDYTSRVYQLAEEATVSQHLVEWDAYTQFNSCIQKLGREFGEDSKSDFCSSILQPLRTLRFRLGAGMLNPQAGFEIEGSRDENILQIARGNLATLGNTYPRAEGIAAAISKQLESWEENVENPLLDKVEQIISGEGAGGRWAIVLRGGSSLAPCQGALQEAIKDRIVDAVQWSAESERVDILERIDVFLDREISSLEETYDGICLAGGPGLFKERHAHLYMAPRARQVHFITFNCYETSVEIGPVFTGVEDGFTEDFSYGSIGNLPGYEVSGPKLKAKADRLELVEPTLDLDEMAEQVERESAGYKAHELVEAHLLELEGGCAVFDSHRVSVIDPYAEAGKHVRQIDIEKVEELMFLVIRSEGGGKYIEPVANKILGDAVQMYRGVQKKWKQALGERCTRMGVAVAQKELVALGCKKAERRQNITNWISPTGTIRTADKDDFIAIMKFVGMEESADDYWDKLGVIHQAHRLAGQQIRRALNAELKKVGIDELEMQGRIDISLPGVESGALSAIRIIRIREETSMVPYTKLCQLMDWGTVK